MADRQKVIVLEDDAIFGNLLAEMLGDYYDVETGSNGLQGIAMCLEGGVAAVVTDIVMPDLDGMQMLLEFRKNPLLVSIPVFIVSTTDFSAEARMFPQVRGTFLKNENAGVIVDAVRKTLQGG